MSRYVGYDRLRVTMCWTEDRGMAFFDMGATRRDLGQHYRYWILSCLFVGVLMRLVCAD